MTQYSPVNGWTKKQMIAQLRERMPKDGSRAGVVHDGEFECRYRAPNGCCAAGAFIPDGVYEPLMEGKAIVFLRNIWGLLPLSMGVMRDLQRVHDHSDVNAVEACVKWVEDNVVDQQ